MGVMKKHLNSVWFGAIGATLGGVVEFAGWLPGIIKLTALSAVAGGVWAGAAGMWGASVLALSGVATACTFAGAIKQFKERQDDGLSPITTLAAGLIVSGAVGLALLPPAFNRLAVGGKSLAQHVSPAAVVPTVSRRSAGSPVGKPSI